MVCSLLLGENMNGKYVLDKNEYKILDDGVIVYRVRAVRGFYTKGGYVEEGEYGGYVENVKNLAQNHTCWIYGDTIVRDKARVRGEAVVYDCEIDKSAVVSDLCLVASSYITDNAVISGRASVLDSFISGNAIVSGPTKLYKSQVSGNSCVFEKEFLEKVVIDKCVGSFTQMEKEQRRRNTYKYSLIPLSGELEGLFRLRANKELINFCGKTGRKVIPEGTLGGIVSGAYNISQYGDCWIDYDSIVLGSASVHDYAYVTGGSVIRGNAVACGSAYISGCCVKDNAYVAGRAKLDNITLCGKSRVFGTASLSAKDIESSGDFVGKMAYQDLFLSSEKDSIEYYTSISQNFD